MDFGLGRYLEMFEERFGRRASTVLLLVISIALFSVCLNLIYSNLVSPIYSAFTDTVSDKRLLKLVLTAVVSFIVCTIIFIVISTVVGTFILRKIKSTSNRVDQSIVKVIKMTDEAEDISGNLVRNAKTIEQIVDSLIKREEAVSEAERRLGIRKDPNP